MKDIYYQVMIFEIINYFNSTKELEKNSKMIFIIYFVVNGQNCFEYTWIAPVFENSDKYNCSSIKNNPCISPTIHTGKIVFLYNRFFLNLNFI